MRSNVIAVAAMSVVASLLGCGQDPPPPFPLGTGQAMGKARLYPAGPYGVGVGSILANYDFVGYVDATVNTSSLQPMSLGDFYNPHGRDTNAGPESAGEDDRLFPPGSPFGEGKLKPTALAIDVSSVWCGPCNLEAKCNLPAAHARYSPCGGQLFLQLADGPTEGTAAVPQDVLRWATKYKEDFPVTLDPASKLSSSFEANAFPANMILDTTTMQIIEVISGIPDASYYRTFDQLLVDSTCPGRQPIPPKDPACP